jgi:hypothetical protein
MMGKPSPSWGAGGSMALLSLGAACVVASVSAFGTSVPRRGAAPQLFLSPEGVRRLTDGAFWGRRGQGHWVLGPGGEVQEARKEPVVDAWTLLLEVRRARGSQPLIHAHPTTTRPRRQPTLAPSPTYPAAPPPPPHPPQAFKEAPDAPPRPAGPPGGFVQLTVETNGTRRLSASAKPKPLRLLTQKHWRSLSRDLLYLSWEERRRVRLALDIAALAHDGQVRGCWWCWPVWRARWGGGASRLVRVGGSKALTYAGACVCG